MGVDTGLPGGQIYFSDIRLATPEEIDNETNKTIINNNEINSMKIIKIVLEGIYNNINLRRRVVPLFMGNTGIGKTWLVEEFAKEKGVHLEIFLTSAKSPFEIDGIGIPNTKRDKAVHVEFDSILKLKDGDILFFDELPNGNPATLNACLTFIESRITASGRKLPNIMVVGAGNYQGMAVMTPQIKRRFKWYNVKFDNAMWQNYMFKVYKMPKEISIKLCTLINKEDFTGYNFFTPADIDKDVEMIINDIPTPNQDVLLPILNSLIDNKSGQRIKLTDDRYLEPNEKISWLQLIKFKNGIITKQ